MAVIIGGDRTQSQNVSAAEDGLGSACGWRRCRLPLHHQVAGEVDKDPKVRVEKENVAEKGKEVEK